MKSQKIAIKCADGTVVIMNGRSDTLPRTISVKSILAGVTFGLPLVAIIAIVL